MSVKKNKNIEVLEVNESIETSLNEITNVESLISEIIEKDSFDKLAPDITRRSENRNAFKYDTNSYDFISVDNEAFKTEEITITEKEFFEIIQANAQGSHKSAGRYQQSLYSYYMQAIEEKDDGYISDIFEKAITLRDNLNEVKALCEDKTFMKEWRKNMGNISPMSILKQTGSMKRINAIRY